MVNMVDHIAFQTSLLAVKAAVEAHRSAEAAKALSALANEANELAARSAQSARDTAAAVELTTAAASAGSGHAEAVAGIMCAVFEKAAEAQALAGEVSADGSEQMRGIGQIARSISQLEEVTKVVSSGADRGVAASVEIGSHVWGAKRIARELAELGGERETVLRYSGNADFGDPVSLHAGNLETAAFDVDRFANLGNVAEAE
jgi:methyl-accepting chemotaxis protein